MKGVENERIPQEFHIFNKYVDAGKSCTLSESLRKKTVEMRSPPCRGYRKLVHAQDCRINLSLVMKKKSNFKTARKMMFSITLFILARNWEISESCTMRGRVQRIRNIRLN